MKKGQSLGHLPAGKVLASPGMKANQGGAREARSHGWAPAEFPSLCLAALLARQVWLPLLACGEWQDSLFATLGFFQ